MQVIYYYDEPPESFSKSIFLAGPSPRTLDVKSWRPEALRILEAKRYDGVVYVPEQKPGDTTQPDWTQAPQWEHGNLDRSDVVLFWVPRDMEILPNGQLKLPGFTTNVEFGHWANSGKAVLGQPPRAPHTGYLRFMADKFHVPILWTLENTIDKALELLENGALRTGGEREIPLFLWKLRAFQNWYQAQLSAGNRLDGAKVEWISRVRNKPTAIFALALRPNVFVASENRSKVNDPVVFRLDISSVILYNKNSNILESEIVLIKEFRTAASTKDGFIWELPGGSSPYTNDPLKVAVEEIREEVGLDIEADRLNYVASRQMAGTLSAHKSHTYSVELKNEELIWLKSQKGIPHGADYPDNPTGEQAYTEVVKLRDIMYNNLVDWANVGMIRSVL